ncbi:MULTISPECIES: hypothetical protein [Burkholderia]|uniref:Uncharacterized protein n=1 Tax=Burkholderia cenocepacia TaxID=95486 RepID=A0ABD4UEV2_9BURK|nr:MULTISPECIES: hypothetical protein [Burkholderia]MBR8094571.1 hypothetical protein [Burkholderia cenocepacia]MBS6359044.1 hypothetical protein [Burkholderia sp.]MBY4714717.1 hypothetical protein [Burkholderia cepacia]MBY4740657.1 hypothetical protein [Burkholderia cepacia]MBY4748125.1 hypothetical protein [Burkholderia cepacia]
MNIQPAIHQESPLSGVASRPARVVFLPDGYNGHTMAFCAEPVAVEGNVVKLHCAEPGKEYLIAWRCRAVFEAALMSREGSAEVTLAERGIAGWRGTNDDEYQIYVESAKALGWKIKTRDEWLNS